jgi:hypothetical protein
VSVGTNATGLTGMLPTAGPNGTQLTGISKGGTAVPYAVNTIKGLDYATFNAGGGSYTATYGSAGTLHLPGTYILVAVFFTALVLYYFVNWKYLSLLWVMR